MTHIGGLTCSDPRVLKIIVAPGRTDEIIELRMDEPNSRRRGPWPPHGNGEIAPAKVDGCAGSQRARRAKSNFRIVSLPTGCPFLVAGSKRQSMAACTALGLSSFWPELDVFRGVALMTLPSASMITFTSNEIPSWITERRLART